MCHLRHTPHFPSYPYPIVIQQLKIISSYWHAICIVLLPHAKTSTEKCAVKPIYYTVLLIAVSLHGCTTYARFSDDFRTTLRTRNYEDARAKIQKSQKRGNQLLYLLENGLLAHYQGHYETSNRYFAEAERLSDRLYTRSVTRETAAFLTNDAIRNYRGDSFEIIAVHYYRALNYWYLGLSEDALVECRKANLKLDQYAIHNGQTSYKNDAFIHYITGLFYEATGEFNDARVSYQHAQDAYSYYEKKFRTSPHRKPSPRTSNTSIAYSTARGLTRALPRSTSHLLYRLWAMANS